MEEALDPDVFTATVVPTIKAAKAGGATARSLAEAFMGAMTKLYGDVDMKETSAMVGFIQLLNAEGGSVSARNAARLYGGPSGYSEEAVRKAARQDQIIAIRDGNGNMHFPVWQFGPRGGAVAGLREIIAILKRRSNVDELSLVTFFINPSARLGDRSPIEALRAGDVETVKRLAMESAE
ncbi:MAG TPA: hypothetical protein VL069_07040 [Opitutus sp.]|nr:hypothetical protein [Opitutus sp.]